MTWFGWVSFSGIKLEEKIHHILISTNHFTLDDRIKSLMSSIEYNFHHNRELHWYSEMKSIKFEKGNQYHLKHDQHKNSFIFPDDYNVQIHNFVWKHDKIKERWTEDDVIVKSMLKRNTQSHSSLHFILLMKIFITLKHTS